MSDNFVPATREDIHELKMLYKDHQLEILRAFADHKKEIDIMCKQNIENELARCSAHNMFSNKETKKAFYDNIREVPELKKKIESMGVNKTGLAGLIASVGLIIKEIAGIFFHGGNGK